MVRQRAEIRIDLDRYRLDRIKIGNDKVNYEYDHSGILNAVVIEGQKLPTLEIVKMINSMFLSQVEDIKMSSFKMLDKPFKQYAAEVTNATATLYTVPTNKVFYLLYFDFNADSVGAALLYGTFYYLSAGVTRRLAGCEAPAAVGAMHINEAFSLLKLPAGDALKVYSGNAQSHIYVATLGVELDA